MKIKRVWAAFFSPVKNTEKITVTVCGAAAKMLGIETVDILDLTKPENREKPAAFGEGDLVVLGMPTYAGRVPNKVMPDIAEHITGTGALGAAVVTYGNRSYDDSLMELATLMKDDGFAVIGGGAFVCQHAFADALATGRPDEEDLEEACKLGRALAEKILAAEQGGDSMDEPVFPGNDPVGPYYVPKGIDGQPAKFLKAKPETDQSRCTDCGICAERCPMGSIEAKDGFEVTGICIKCQACIKSCPTGAKYMTDEAFFSHKAMLEANFAARRAENILVL